MAQNKTYNQGEKLVIAIAGGSCTGKGYLCSRLRENFRPRSCAILPMDAYYRDLSHVPEDERGAWNFDTPEALDHQSIIDHLKILIGGGTAEVPIYNFSTHTRQRASSQCLLGGEIIILEGLYALYWGEIRKLALLKVFIDLPWEVCLERRINRDSHERGRTRESVEAQFRRTVLPMYEAHVTTTRDHADLMVRGDAPIEVLAAEVFEAASAKVWVRND